MILDYLQKNPDAIKKVKEFCENNCRTNPKPICKEKALVMYISLDLTKSKYNILRNTCNEDDIYNFPSYYQIKEAKKECYPPEESVTITESSACVRLQAILDVTTRRILELCKEKSYEYSSLQLTSKWGFDGAAGQSLYKKIFSTDHTSEKVEDSYIFITSFVPLKLTSKSTNEVLWENEHPSSSWFCRSIRFEFIKESPEVMKSETDRMQREIENLIPTQINERISIEHELLFTMIDGKVCSTLSETSSAVCYICKAKPSEMNNLQKLATKVLVEEHYNYGMSSLHAWIRCMECLLHIAYNLEFKRWSARTMQNRALHNIRKKQIQDALRSELGILVDVVKQGVGNTNDGNTARKFFEDPEKTADILGLDAALVRRFAVLLQAIASGEEVNAQRFGKFAEKTTELYVELYGWYYMPISVHKILIHGADIIQHVLILVGKLCEEAVEARHKEFRKTRIGHARKITREATNHDVFYHLLLTSDPYLSTIRFKTSRLQKKEYFPETLNLFSSTPDPNSELNDIAMYSDS